MSEVPSFVAPMLATSARLPPDGPQWTFEPKWDGMRVIVRCADGSITLASRRGNDASATYPELTGGAERLGVPAILDAEVVAMGADGRPDFQRLQERMHRQRPSPVLVEQVPVDLLVFDLLWLGDRSTTELPWSDRRHLLEELEVDHGRWLTSPTYREEGQATLAAARRQGLEGVVAKRVDSVYEPGRRSRSWLKEKLLNTVELVVGGWMPGEGNRAGTIGSLLVGAWDPGGDLRWAGSVGSGLSGDELEWFRRHLRPRASSPFVPPATRPGAQWAEPEVVVDVAYREITGEGLLRQPVYRGRRNDVAPGDVTLPEGHPGAGPVR